MLEVQYQAQDGQLPFTLESAIYFRRVQQALDEGGVPGRDAAIEWPDGIEVAAMDTVGDEWVVARIASWLPGALSDNVRWVHLVWFCLGIPLMGIWIWRMSGSYVAGCVGAAFYAVSLSAVIRSTGQELSHENMALPFLLAHLAFSAWFLDQRPRASAFVHFGRDKSAGPTVGRPLADRRAEGRAFYVRWLSVVLSALCLGLALWCWDMIQFYLMMWVLLEWWRFLRMPPGGTRVRASAIPGRAEARPSRGAMMLFGLAVYILVFVCIGIINPYYRAHGFLLSPVMGLLYGLFSARILSRKWVTSRCLLISMALVFPVLCLMIGHSYMASYGHFGELLLAKLRFLNVKPQNPVLLTFNQRIMWVPALHSATIGLTFTLFPVFLILTFFAIPVLYSLNNRSYSKNNRLIVFYIVSLVSYCLFVRFHVFVVIFGSGMLGMFTAWGVRQRMWVKVLVMGVLLVGVSIEAHHTASVPERWGRSNTYYREQKELLEWLEKHVAPMPVLANFGISASIVTYSGCPVILHPKFESPEIRRKVHAYGTTLFHGDEREFRDWMEAMGAEYYVYGRGEFASVGIDQQMRYMVDKLDPLETSPAYIYEFRPGQAMYARLVWENRKYRVFKIILKKDERMADECATVAQEAFEQGQLHKAEKKAIETLTFMPNHEKALEILQHVSSLREKGFSFSNDENP